MFARIVRTINQATTKTLIILIRIYQLVLSPLFGNCCRFYPSCSHYACQAVAEHGALKGAWLTAWRLLRCQPFNAGGYDPVPQQKTEN